MRQIFESTTINSMVLKNRLVRSATWENMADSNGHITERLLGLYEELAKGGVGLIIGSCTAVMPKGQFHPGMLGIWDDSFISGYKKLTELVHQHGAAIFSQIACGGAQGDVLERQPVWGPSNVTDLASGITPTPMTKEDILVLTRAFGDAAARAKSAGFDGIQIHAAHGYLLGQFLSPYYNRRTDEFGGSVENRARIILDIYDEIRDRVGSDYPVTIKINSDDYIENGATIVECRFVCQELAKRGIDAIEISGGTAASGDYISRRKINSPEKEGYHAEYAAKIADEVQVPIILVGGLRSTEVIERLLEQTKIELFALARPLIAEPDLPKRWQADKTYRAKCISCNRCLGVSSSGNVCILNQKK